MAKKVLVGMSGGVDSSVAALLLKEQGYEVVGVTFSLWNPPVDSGLGFSTCCSQDDIADARRVCHAIGIPHYVFNYRELFEERVVTPFVESYRRGLTPNPCIDCNRFVKFSAFLQRAKELDFDYIATGHYGKVETDPATGRHRLYRSEQDRKDQSYVLYSLTQDQLSYLLLPLWGYEKEEVRATAAEHGLPTAQKPDSQDICFVPDGDFAGFLERYAGQEPKPGAFLDESGAVIGEHRGSWRFTIGQRRGLGMGFGKHMYVAAIDPAKNTVTLTQGAGLYRSTLTAGDCNFIPFETLTQPLAVEAKIRYAHRAAPATITPLPGGQVRVEFQEPQRAITPGQAVVFYQGREVLGGGTILPLE